MFTVRQRVINNGAQAVSLSPYGLLNRTGTPETLGFYILHEGLIGILNESLQEVDYSDVKDAEKRTIPATTTGGWLGITDKYWGTALIPDQSVTVNTRFFSPMQGSSDVYQADYVYKEPLVAAPGGTVEAKSLLFAGAKRVVQIDTYRDNLGIAYFDKIVDFGWFYYITKPLFYALHWLNEKIGNFGIAILILTVCIKALFFPLANKSYKAMAKMRKLQPDMLSLRERFGEDKQRLNQEMMALYKREGANPMSGCLPILIQIPVFFALYKVMFVTIEMRQAPFFGWIKDLSAPDPTSILNAFGLFPWGVPELGALNVLNLGVWPLVMGITMFLQQRLNPQPPDPIQAKIFLFMPIMFTFLLATFPAGLVIYWAWNNTLSILQQMLIMKQAGVSFGTAGKKT
jgi:YidC/Oxa1 family membrane protein insertase